MIPAFQRPLKQPLTCKFEECGNRERWLERRSSGIGASTVAVALGLSPYLTGDDVLALLEVVNLALTLQAKHRTKRGRR